MRRFDKKKNMERANILLEQRRLAETSDIIGMEIPIKLNGKNGMLKVNDNGYYVTRRGEKVSVFPSTMHQMSPYGGIVMDGVDVRIVVFDDNSKMVRDAKTDKTLPVKFMGSEAQFIHLAQSMKSDDVSEDKWGDTDELNSRKFHDGGDVGEDSADFRLSEEKPKKPDFMDKTSMSYNKEIMGQPKGPGVRVDLQEDEANNQFSNINFNVGGKSYITKHIIKERAYNVINGQPQAVIDIAVNTYDDGVEGDNMASLAVFLEYVYDVGKGGRLLLYYRGDSKGELINLVGDDGWRNYIQVKLIDKLEQYAMNLIENIDEGVNEIGGGHLPGNDFTIPKNPLDMGLTETENDTYFETLSATLDFIREKAIKMGLIVYEPDMWTNYGTGGISYGQTKRAFIKLMNADGEPILNKRGKELNRGLVVSIYRMDSGKYELTLYKSW